MTELIRSRIVQPKAILAAARSDMALRAMAEKLLSPITPTGTPFAKTRIGFVSAVDVPSWTCTAYFTDLTTPIPGIPILDEVVARPNTLAAFTQVGNQYTLIGMLSRKSSGALHEVDSVSVASNNNLGTGVEIQRLQAVIPDAKVGIKYRAHATAMPLTDAAGAYTQGRLRWETVSGGVTGTVFANSIVDHRLANRAEQLKMDGDFTWAGTEGVDVYVKFTMFAGGATTNGNDQGATFGPTKLWVDAVG